MTSSRISQTSGPSRSTSFLAALMVVAIPRRFEFAQDEGFEELKRHLFRQATLMQFQGRTNHDDRPPGIVDALAEQVLAEASLLCPLIMSRPKIFNGSLFGGP